MDIRNLRLNYKKSTIDFTNLEDHPVKYFLNWFADALAINKEEANACVLSTVSENNLPSSRIVLLKEVNEDGFTFFTNYNSNKSKDIEKNPNVALNFYWPALERQVRIEGSVNKISPKDSDNYFKTRPRESQIGAWISEQSKEIGLHDNLIDAIKIFESKFQGKEIDRPLHWGGYCIDPSSIEFWQGRPSRLHDRLLYKLEGERWKKKKLSP